MKFGRTLLGVMLLVTNARSINAQPTSRPATFLIGADVSTLDRVQQQGGVYRDENGAADGLTIFERHGWNCFRLRLFVNPNGRFGVINNLDYTLALAKRIKASGATLLLDFHYSDTWADPQHQIKPAAWASLPFDELEAQVEQYTADTLRVFATAGAMPDIVQIGNEITGGTLWPDAQVAVPHSSVKVYDAQVKEIEVPQPYEDRLQWTHLTRILKAGARGVTAASATTLRPRIMIHVDCGGDWPTTQWFFDHLVEANVSFDLIGQSYYPNWHGTIENVRDNLARTAARYGKDIVIVETAYPKIESPRFASEKNMNWPPTPAGQRQFLEQLMEVVHSTPGGHGAGVVYWHPEGIPTTQPTTRPRRSDANSLFDDEGRALPAIDLAR